MKVCPAETNVELISVGDSGGAPLTPVPGSDVAFEKGPLAVESAGKPDDTPVSVVPGGFVQADHGAESVYVVTDSVMVLRTYVVPLVSTDDTPVPETLTVPVPVGPGVKVGSVLLAKGPRENDVGSGPRPVPPVISGTDEGQPGPRQGVDVLDGSTAVRSLAGTIATSDALTSKTEQSIEPHVTEMISLLK